MDRIPLEIQEALILEDLLFVLMVCVAFIVGGSWPDALIRVYQVPISHTLLITRSRTRIHCKVYASWLRHPLVC